METFLSDNKGNRVAPGVTAIDPVAASGITLNPANTNNATKTVVGGERYAVTVVGSSPFKFSITGTTVTAANIEWVCCPHETIIIKIPEGTTSLNYAVLTASQGSNMAFLRKVA